jgi:hypothetical protein
MKKVFNVSLFLVLLLSLTFVVAGTTKITVRMDDQYNSLIRVKDGDTIIETPKIINYPMGLAELIYETSRSQADYQILIHKSGDVSDSYTLENIDTGSELMVDFRKGVPPLVTDLEEEVSEETEVVVAIEETINEPEVEEVEVETFNLDETFSTGKAIFYSNETGFTVFSWIFLGVLVLIAGFFIFGSLKNKQTTEVEKYKNELESIRRKIRKKIKEIKILKARGIKIKKVIELEEGFLEEKKGLGNIEKDLDEKKE